MTNTFLKTAIVIVTLLALCPLSVANLDYSYPLKRSLDAMLKEDATLEDVVKLLFASSGSHHDGHNIDKRAFFQLPKIISAIKNTSSECQAAFYSVGPSLFDTFKGKLPFWILSMIDSAGKFTSGTMRGSRMRMGSYNQCVRLDIDARPGSTPAFRGSMCSVIAEYPKLPREYRVWELQNNHIYPAKPVPETYETQVCVPSLCTENDVHSLVTAVARIVGEDFVVTNVRCFYYKDHPFSTWTIFVIVCMVILILLFTAGTLYDTLIQFQASTGSSKMDSVEHDQNVENIKKNMGALGRSILAFSVPNNLYYVLTADMGDRTLQAMNGIKFITLIWVIVANIYYLGKDIEWKNYAGLLEDLRSSYAQILINVRFAADTMFCCSGILVSYLTLKQISKSKGSFNLAYFYMHRILRVTPVYMAGIMFVTAFYFHLGEGVQWMKTDEYQTQCGKHWWKGLLFINNFFPEAEKCVPLSWYLAADFQLYLMAPVFLYPLYGFPKFGLGLLGFEISLFMIIPAIITQMYNLPYFIGRKFYFHANHQDYLNLILYKPWSHAGPYLIGILYGYLLYAKGSKITMKPMTVAIGWIVSICIVLMLLFGFYPYIDGTSEMPKMLGVLYVTTSGTLWAVAIGWTVYACAAGYGGHHSFMNEFLTLEFFLSTGKMTFVAFLAQDIINRNFLGTRPDVYYYDLWMIIVIFCGTIFLSLITSISLNTLVYEPIRQLDNIWLRKQYGKRGSSIVHFAVAPSSSEDEFDESITKLIADEKGNNQDGDDDDDMESMPAYMANNANNVLSNVDLGKQFKVFQNGNDNTNKLAEETTLLVVNQ